MAEFDRIRRNLNKMIAQNAPESDLDSYVESEGVTAPDLQIFGKVGEWRDASRAEIGGKLKGLDEPLRKRALDVWAQNELAREDDRKRQSRESWGPLAPVLGGIQGVNEFAEQAGSYLIGAGFMDEVGAAGSSVIGGVDYDTDLALSRARMARASEEAPIAAQALGIGASLFLPGLRAFKGASTGAQVGNAAATGAAYAGAEGFGRGEGDASERLQQGATSAAIGAGAGAAIGGLAAGLARGGGQRAADRAALAADAAEVAPSTPAAASYGTAGRHVAGALTGAPIIGSPMRTALQKSADELTESAARVADDYAAGLSQDPAMAGEAASRAIAGWIRSPAPGQEGGSAKVIGRMMDRVHRLVPISMRARMEHTQEAARKLLSGNKEIGLKINDKALEIVRETLRRVRADEGGPTLEQLTHLRTVVGARMDDALLPEGGTAKPALKRLYGALTRDMRDLVAGAGPRALDAWERAQRVSKMIMDRREQLSKIVGADGSRSGEAVVHRLLSMAGTKSSADVKAIEQARRVIGPEAWGEVAGSAIRQLGMRQGDFNVATFVTKYNSLSARGRQALFGGGRNTRHKASLDMIARVGEKLKGVNAFGNPSGTGGVGTLLAGLGAFAAGNVKGLAVGAAGGYGAAHLLSRPVAARGIAQYLSVLSGHKNGRAGLGAVRASAVIVADQVEKMAKENGANVNSALIVNELMRAARDTGSGERERAE